jgi:hypothetical protein
MLVQFNHILIIIKIFLFISIFTSFSYTGEIQRGINLPQNKYDKVLRYNQKIYPKLWETIDEITKNDVDVYITYLKKGSPAQTRGKHSISMNYKIFFHPSKHYPQGRLVVVMLHEYGHILFNRNKSNKGATRTEREYYAFKYSVERAIELAHDGYREPIEQLVHYLPLRLKHGKKGNPHNQALKKLTQEKFWLDVINKYAMQPIK